MYPLISVIVPVYKVEKFLQKCVNSVLTQTYTNLEVILVDDGSPDRCGVLCDEYAKKDSRILVLHKKNGGLSDARNAGLEIAKGAYIGFVDSDDYIDPRMYERLYAAIYKSEADLAVCAYDWVDEAGNPKKSPYLFPIKNRDMVMNQHEAFCTLFDRSNLVTAVNKLYKCSLLNDKAQPLRFPVGRIHEDEFIIHRLLYRCNRIVSISDKLYFYVQRNSSIMSSNYSLKRLDAYYAAVDRVCFFKEIGEKKFANKAFYHVFCAILISFLRLDMSLSENRKIIYPLFRKTFFELIKNHKFLLAGCLLLTQVKILWDFVKRGLQGKQNSKTIVKNQGNSK